MKKSLALLLLIPLIMTACNKKDGDGDGGDVAKGGDCPSETKITVLKTSDGDLGGFDHIAAYANFNKTFGTYRAIFINYPKSEDSDFKSHEGDEKKIVIGVFNRDGDDLKPGDFTLFNPNTFSAQLESADGLAAASSINEEDIGGVNITRIDDEMICGTVDVKDSSGFELKGSFALKNE